MKKSNYLFYVILSILFISCNNNDIDNKSDSKSAYEEFISSRLDCMNMSRPSDSYNYPVYPGMPEWAELRTVEEMIAACQIPEDILKKMSTQAVIQAIWEYPFLLDVLHRMQYQLDFEGIFLQNNAYKELINRNDAGLALLERLKNVDPLVIDATREPKALEVIMSQTIFLAQLHGEVKTLIETTLQKDSLRQNNMENDPFRTTVWLLIGNTLASANYNPFMEEIERNNSLKSFLDDKYYVCIEEVMGDIPQIILHYTQLYLNK